MNANEIVNHQVRPDRESVVLGLPGENVRQASEAARVHADRQIAALDIRA